jgi:ATP-binding protein involved in chromosome partitioning
MATTDLHHSQHHAPDASSQPAVGAEKLPGIRHIVAVGGGKAGPKATCRTTRASTSPNAK